MLQQHINHMVTDDQIRNNRRLREFLLLRKFIKFIRIGALLLVIYLIVHGV